MAEILKRVADYYTSKLERYGQTARGVDWNGEESQTLRFKQLTRIVDRGSDFSINDLGCGYGALLEYLDDHFTDFGYIGWDVSKEMVEAATKRFETHSAQFNVASEPSSIADFGVASGIFNVKVGSSDEAWREYVISTLHALDRTSRRGFSFNCLTSYSDPEKMSPDLFYADPCQMFDICKRSFSRHVALLHDYGLYEFTILVRKDIG